MVCVYEDIKIDVCEGLKLKTVLLLAYGDLRNASF